MTTRQFSVPALVALATTLHLLEGCSSRPSGAVPSAKSTDQSQQAAHDPDDVPITEEDIGMPSDYAALVTRVEQLVTDIHTKIEAGTPSKAHRSLDELDIILKKAAEIASRSVPREHWKDVNVQSKELAQAHDELHERIDANQMPDYTAVAERIHKAVESLKAVPAN